MRSLYWHATTSLLAFTHLKRNEMKKIGRKQKNKECLWIEGGKIVNEWWRKCLRHILSNEIIPLFLLYMTLFHIFVSLSILYPQRSSIIWMSLIATKWNGNLKKSEAKSSTEWMEDKKLIEVRSCDHKRLKEMFEMWILLLCILHMYMNRMIYEVLWHFCHAAFFWMLTFVRWWNEMNLFIIFCALSSVCVLWMCL